MTTIEQLQALRSHREDRAYTSVYGDALKRRQDMDICNLFYGNEAATQAFLRTILNAPSFSLELQTDEPSGEPIKQLYFEADARYRLGGEHQLGFGYPMLIRRDERSPNGYIAAPIFIWHLQLVASPTKPNLYTLVRTLHQDVEVNPLLLHYLENVSEQNLRTALEPELLAACAGNRLKDQRMLAVCNALSIALGMVSHSTPYNIVPIPAPATALTEEGRIVFAGVLGMFEPYHASSDELLKQLTAPAQFASPVLFENDVLPTLGNHPYTDTQLDAYQEEVLRAIHATRDVCVVAPANTDKIGLLRGIAANALANGARCLIVSPNTALLQAVETHAKDKGYGQLALRLQDGRYEKNNFLLQLQAATLSIKTPIPFRGDEFQLLINNTQRQETHLGETYAMLRERMFGNNNRSETVGLFLEQHFRESKHLLTGKLDPSTWVFTEDTYHLALTHVLTARRLYEPLGTLTHPLEQLHPSLFAAGTDSATAGDRFHTVVEEKLRRARQIEQSHDRVLEDYESLLEADFTARHLSLYRAADDLAHALANYTTEYGADFDRHDWAKRTQLSVAAMFGAKPRAGPIRK